MSYIFNIIIPIITKNNIQGNNTNNHDKPECPSLHIKFNIYVQNNTYINLIMNIKAVFGTRQEKQPT